VQSANLVAVWIAQVSKIKLAGWAFAKSRRIFTGGAAIGNTSRMKGIALLG
jgi:hypothetical protein